MFDLTPAIDAFSEEVIVTRANTPSTTKGRKTDEGAKETFTASGSFQPMTQKELMRLPEGQRNSGRSKFYSACELLTVELSTCNTPDELEVNGVAYQVDKVDDWNTIAGFFRYELGRLNR